MAHTGNEVVKGHKRAIAMAKETGVSHQHTLHFVFKHELKDSCRSTDCILNQFEMLRIQKYIEEK